MKTCDIIAQYHVSPHKKTGIRVGKTKAKIILKISKYLEMTVLILKIIKISKSNSKNIFFSIHLVYNVHFISNSDCFPKKLEFAWLRAFKKLNNSNYSPWKVPKKSSSLLTLQAGAHQPIRPSLFRLDRRNSNKRIYEKFRINYGSESSGSKQRATLLIEIIWKILNYGSTFVMSGFFEHCLSNKRTLHIH